MLSHETPAWGSNSPYKYTYTYNAENQMLTEVFDYDGTMNLTTTWTYETGFSARKLSETKTGHAEAVTAKTTWSYDDVAQCKGISDIAVTDTSAPCTDDLTQAECTGTCFWMEGTITWKSDDDDDINLNTGEYSQKVYYHMNTLTQLLEGSDSINTGMQYTFNPSSWVMYTYDAPAGKTLTKAKYARSDWTLKGKTTWTYDSAGNVLTEEIDEDADGTAEETQAWTYDSDGNMLSHNATYPNYTVTESWTYDSSGNKLTHTYADSSSTGTETDTWSYACQ
jgi:hypothetical protein